MRWDMGQRSRNVEDRRGMGVPLVAGTGVVAVLLIAGIVYLLGGDPSQILQGALQPDQVQSSAQSSGQPGPLTSNQRDGQAFVAPGQRRPIRPRSWRRSGHRIP